jgi:hypothetical protein
MTCVSSSRDNRRKTSLDLSFEKTINQLCLMQEIEDAAQKMEALATAAGTS